MNDNEHNNCENISYNLISDVHYRGIIASNVSKIIEDTKSCLKPSV